MHLKPLKRLVTLFLILSFFTAWSQKEIKTTDEFTVVGQIESELTFTLSNLEKFESQKIADVVITNHLGEKKGTAKNLKGVLLKDILSSIKFKSESPKVLSEFFLTFIAIDGYKVVYSWNEIFNSPTGDNLYVVTEKEGKKLTEMDDRILLVTTTDFKTGRRFVKGLTKIIVGRAE